MPVSKTSFVTRYGVALVAVGVAIALRSLVTPWLGISFPLATMFPAVAFVVWAAGWGPALLTAFAGWFAAGVIFRGGFIHVSGGFSEVVGLVVYMLSCGSVVLLGEAMRAAQRKLEAQQQELSTSNLVLANRVEAQSLLAAIVASSEDAIISKTLDGVITSWNKGAEGMFGWRADEAIGRSIHLIVPPALHDEERRILERLRNGERLELHDVERVRKDGSCVHALVTISPVHDRHGHIIGASSTARDITARKAWEGRLVRSEEALREQRDVMQLAMRTARMGAWARDLQLDTVWWSPEFAELFGLSPDDTNYARERLFGQVSTADRLRLPQLIEDALKTREDYVIEFEFQHAGTGEWRWMESRGRAEYTADGKPIKLYGVAIDITERRKAVAALQEADRRKDEFLATLAHELRNPLAPISSGLHILRSAQGPEQATTALEIMDRQVGQMVRLVDDLLDVARITTGKVDLRNEPFDLADAIRDALETSAPEFKQRANPFTLNPPAEPVFVNGDRTRLAQVFANLLNNSARYSDPGQPIVVTFSREGGDAVVRVCDEGMGIHSEMLPRIFEMFRQADRTGGRSRGGLGVGLSLVKRIVEMHGGTVTAHSAGLGQGSEFMVRIPAIDASLVSRHNAATASAHAENAPRKVLVVDDNQDAAESLAALLSINGHETRMAHDGKDAVKQAEAFAPDVVFLDIGMPGMDGHETAKLIRQQPWGQTMVLVALTGWGQSEDRRRSKDAGFDHHLVKPADPAVVEQLLATL